ncbi:MAG: LysM peptidoglycan-binding domain-containing protein [Chloroflexi bacterium]|nr:LysM peptidoglycan-binding domain-containing protein [Chloroflexota bacterium]
MRSVRELANALMAALISIGLMLGALSISLVEFVPNSVPTVTDFQISSPEPLTVTATLPPTISLDLATSAFTTIFTDTPLPPLACQPPFGWTNQISIQFGDSLASIADRYRISMDALRSANCLLSDSLIPGSMLYVPPAPTSTMAACVPGAVGWINNYVVQPGDTLYRIGYNHYTTLDLMRLVNCRRSDTIYPGERLWVPNVSTRTPSPTPLPGVTITVYPTELLTATTAPTNTPVPPTLTPTPTTPPSVTPTPTPTATPTDPPPAVP